MTDFKWDIYVSYSRNDEQDAGEKGWVSSFVDMLGSVLNNLSPTKVEIFFDRDRNVLLGRQPYDAAQAELLLAITSPRYLKSEWARAELNSFIARHNDPHRLFVVERLPPSPGQAYPEAVDEVMRTNMWRRSENGTPVPMIPWEDDSQADRVYDLARQILEVLGRGGRTTPPVGGRATTVVHDERRYAPVLVGHSSADVEEEREFLITYLQQLGVEVISLRGQAPETAEELDAQMDHALKDVAVYAQLLGGRKGRVLRDASESVVQRQWRIASVGMAPRDMFLWRPDDVDPRGISDESYRSLAEKAVNCSIPEFAKDIFDRLAHRPNQATDAVKRGVRVFLSYSTKDKHRIRPLAKALESPTCSVWWDPYIRAGERYRDTIEAQLCQADFVVVAWSFESVKSHWVQEEAEEGLRRGCLIPVRIDPVDPPLGLRSFQAIDLTKWQAAGKDGGLGELLDRLRPPE